MNALTLSLASIRTRKLQSFLCVLAVACGIALLSSVYLLFSASEQGLMKNAQGVNIVVGAKGSPLQLVLSTIYHGDIPTGNIDMHDMEEIEKNPQIKSAIPLAVGDNYKGFRIVGTTPDYPALYKADLRDGKMFAAPYEVVAGAKTGLIVGEKFAAAHGFAADSDDIHDDHLYNVSGVLKPTGTVLDRLILTQYQSVQDLHGHHEEHEEHEAHHEEEDEHELGHQITALLIKVNNPAAMMNLPRKINQDEHVMAVVPSHVMARVMKNTGIGRDGVVFLGCVFLTLSMLMLLSVLASGLAQRKYDLAILRVLGASSGMLALTVLIEGLVLSAGGAALGLVAGHGIAYLVAMTVPAIQSLLIPSLLLWPVTADLGFMAAGILCGAIASALPCLTAGRADAAVILAQGR
jgi:putative ABC transport system permease protein